MGGGSELLGYRTDGHLLSSHYLALTFSFSSLLSSFSFELHSDGVFVWLVDRIWRVVWNGSKALSFTVSFLQICLYVFVYSHFFVGSLPTAYVFQ